MTSAATTVPFPHTQSSYGSPIAKTPQYGVHQPSYGDVPEKAGEILQVAQKLYDQEPDWVTFFRELLGLNGVVRKNFPLKDQMDAFEHTDEYEQIQHMVAKLREKSGAKDTPNAFEPTRVITVRLPKSLHESLRAEAHEKRTSMNKLCISKLLQFIDNDLVPTET